MERQSNGRLLTVLVTALLTACSSSSNTDGNANKISEINVPGMIVTGLNGQSPNLPISRWFVNVNTIRSASGTSSPEFASAQLFDNVDLLDTQLFIDFFAPRLEQCTNFIQPQPQPSSNTNEDSNAQPAIRVLGGDTVSISSPVQVWAELNSLEDEFGPLYKTSNGPTSAMPDNASLSIPGSDSFPAVDAYPLYEPEAPIRLSPARAELINSDSIYSWIPGNNLEKLIAMDFYAYEIDGTVIETVANCQVIDDGNFELPADIQTLLNNYDRIEVFYFRSARRLDLVGDVLFYQKILVGE